MREKTVEFRRVLDLADYIEGQEIIGYGVCYDQTLVVLTSERNTKLIPRKQIPPPSTYWDPVGLPDDGVYALSSSGWTRIADADAIRSYEPPPDMRLTNCDQPYDMTLLRIGSALVQKVVLRSQTIPFPRVQIFPDDSILVVQRNNVSLYNKAGGFERHLHLGPFQDVQVSASGEVWVSYGDQAVLSDGWPGLSCFSRGGALRWSFKHAKNSCEGDLGYLYDCDAINVVGENVWACYFENYPVVCINKDRRITGWRNEFTSVDAIAVDGNNVLMYSRANEYLNRTHRCMLQTLGTNGELHQVESYQLVLPEGVDEMIGVFARGSSLHGVANSCWYALSIDDLI